MGILIDQIRIANDFTDVNVGERNLIADVGFEVTVVITGKVRIAVDATVDNVIKFAPDGYVDGTYIEMENNGGDFREFVAGDSINILGSTSNDGQYTVVEVFDDSTIRIDATLTQEDSTASTYVQAFRDYNSANFKYGFVDNNGAYSNLSLLDGSAQNFYVEDVDVSNDGVTVGTYKSWATENDSLEILISNPNVNTSSPTYGQSSITITHTFLFMPYLRHIDDLLTPPAYFLNDKALKYTFEIFLKPNANALNRFMEYTHDLDLGNTGWFGERYNTGITKYSVQSFNYKKDSDASVVGEVQLTDADKTRVEVFIENTIDAPFDVDSQAIAMIQYVPQNTTEYYNKTTYLNENIYLDRAINTDGAIAVNGEFARLIEDMTVTTVSPTVLRVNFNVNISSGDFAVLFGKETPEYFIAVGVHKSNTLVGDGDGVMLPVEKNFFGINLGLEDLTSTVSIDYYQHYDDILASPIQGKEAFFKEDEIVVKKQVKIDTTESAYDPILKSVTAGVRVYNASTLDAVDLYTYTYDCSLDPTITDMPYMDASLVTSFQADAGDKIKEFKLKRREDLDAADNWFYDLTIPFLIRWEDWEQNNIIPNALLNLLLPNNNLNNDWDNKDTAGYVIQVFSRFIIELGGTNYASEEFDEINILDYDEGVDWTPFTFELEDMQGNPLPAGFAIGFDQFKIKASTDYLGGTPPLIDEVELVLRVEPTQNGGQFTSVGFSTIIDRTNVQFEGITTPLLADKSISTLTYSIEAIVNGDQLQDFENYDFTARIYNLNSAVPSGAKLLEDGSIKLMEDGSIKIAD